MIIVVRRGDGDVLAFERADVRGAWQLPQGGIDVGETATAAAWRELREETGLGPEQVQLVGTHPRWTVYEWPGVGPDAERRGQAHRWYIFEVLDESVEPVPDGHEFVGWRWMRPGDLVDQVVEFRRPGYREVLGEATPTADHPR